MASPSPGNWIRLDRPQPHPENARRLLARHPEIRTLIGRNPWSFAVIVGLVLIQSVVAIALGRGGAPFWLVFIAAWTIGALADHGLWVMIHEAGHRLVFRTRRGNHVAGVVANLPLLWPSYFNFARYHGRHHTGLGEYEEDPDLAYPWEAKLVGHGPLGKAIWFMLFPLVQGIRPFHTPPTQYVTRAGLTALGLQFVYVGSIIYLGGVTAFLYMLLSLAFSIGLHPLGARWIQEHYTLDGEQETFSYYGPGNLVAFNIGYHNEHHDFPSIPWNRLPRLTTIASEHYGALRSYRSWTRVLLSFLFDPRWSLESRILRSPPPAPVRDPA